MTIRLIVLFLFFQFFGDLPLQAQVRKTNLPTLYIKTDNNSPVSSKEEYIGGSLSALSSESEENLSSVRIKIRGRGNSTWRMSKKSFRIKFDDKLHFLDLPAKEDDWVLLANYADKTLMRNAVAFELSRFLGMEFTPSVQFVDVVLNGEFLGNYMLTDQVEVKNDRLPLQKLSSSMVSLPEISGGYLLEADGFADGSEKFTTREGLKIVIKYPDEEDINDAQRQYISTYTQEFEDALFSLSFKDENTGYQAYVDLPSLIDWYICVELTGNSDGFWSTYFYKKRNDPKFKFGPVWDFDIAFNNDDRLGDATQKLMKDAAHNPKQWILRLLQDEELENKVALRWQELQEQGVVSHLLNYVDSMEQVLDASQQMNFERWDILDEKVYRELEARGSFEAEVAFLRNYLQNRASFLDNQWKIQVPTETFELLESSKSGKAMVPQSELGESWYMDIAYNDQGWEELDSYPAGVGYEKSSGYEHLISLNVAEKMYVDGLQPNTSCYLRFPFNLNADDLDGLLYLNLHIFYDDGFVAYLNGQKVYQVNAPQNPVWNSGATGQHEAQMEEVIDLSSSLPLLKEGENLLAIHGLNAATSSSDFLVSARLIAHKPIVKEEEEQNPEHEEENEEEVITDIGDPEQAEYAHVYPNPVSKKATVNFWLERPTSLQFIINNQSGAVVKESRILGEAGRNIFYLSPKESYLPAGLYTIRLLSNTGCIFNEKIWVEK